MIRVWILCLLPLLVNAECPTGWKNFHNKCYFLSHTLETWIGASIICQSFHSKLAEPKTKSEIGYLSSEVSHVSAGEFWIGITDIIADNQWIYDSSLTPIEITNWGPNEPGGHLAENCLIMSAWFHGKYADVECHTKRKFICERDEP
ncbi:C-type lectin domain family 3 member A-like [Saccostrea echinata]|uniref:C-type lectin domain family 3 member A-like n=1 Tax=Saccostrea echinata TaxID=191078 RepID=UPI002A82892C|nr:C-type lectin domain family 3 member A-like [Saccostrea echinata]